MQYCLMYGILYVYSSSCGLHTDETGGAGSGLIWYCGNKASSDETSLRAHTQDLVRLLLPSLPDSIELTHCKKSTGDRMAAKRRRRRDSNPGVRASKLLVHKVESACKFKSLWWLCKIHVGSQRWADSVITMEIMLTAECSKGLLRSFKSTVLFSCCAFLAPGSLLLLRYLCLLIIVYHFVYHCLWLWILNWML